VGSIPITRSVFGFRGRTLLSKGGWELDLIAAFRSLVPPIGVDAFVRAASNSALSYYFAGKVPGARLGREFR
jgi:hypothetical protein